MSEILDVCTAKARFGAAVRWGHPDRDDRERDLVEARISHLIEELVTTAPPLRRDQIDRITALLDAAGSDR